MVNFRKPRKQKAKPLPIPADNVDGDSEDDIVIYDSENYRGDKEHIFNHQELVMESLRKINEAGSHELRTGWFNETIDNSGSMKRVYVEDTRKKFIECVKTAIMVMRCDFDLDAHETVDGYTKSLETEHKKLLDSQWNWYTKLPPNYRKSYEGRIVQGFFNTELGWYLKYIEIEVDCYRAIAEELNNLSKRLDFYRTADFIAT